MKTIYLFWSAFLIVAFSCNPPQEKQISVTGGLVYTVKAPAGTSEKQITNVISVLQNRFNCLGIKGCTIINNNENGLDISLPNVNDTLLYSRIFARGLFEIDEMYSLYDLLDAWYRADSVLSVWPGFDDMNLQADSNGQANLLVRLVSMPLYQANDLSGTFELGFVDAKDTAVLMKLLVLPVIKSCFEPQVRFILGTEVPTAPGYYSFYAIKSGGDPLIKGAMIDTAYVKPGENGGMSELSINLLKDFHDKWKQITTDNIDRNLAMCIDGRVYSAPSVMEAIAGGRRSLRGTCN